MATAAPVALEPDGPRGRPATAVGRVALFLTLALPGWLAAIACPPGMVPIGDQYCVDRHEATLDQDSHAVSTPGASPAVNVSGVQAAAACAAAGKRLCTDQEWVRGMDHTELEQLLASCYRMCAKAGIEPLPDDEARVSARAMMALLVPAFAAEFRKH